MASFRCYDKTDVIKTLLMTNFYLFLIKLYAQNWEVLTLKNCYSIEPPSYASTAYVVGSFGLVSFLLFRKHLGNLREFFGHMVYPPPPRQKIARTPESLNGVNHRRKTAKNLVDNRKNGKILTVSRK